MRAVARALGAVQLVFVERGNPEPGIRVARAMCAGRARGALLARPRGARHARGVRVAFVLYADGARAALYRP